MHLDSKETAIVDAFRRLPRDTAEELANLVQRLAELSATTRIDWSESWSEDDLRDFTAHSIRRLA